MPRAKLGDLRISLIHQHPMTKGAIVIVSRCQGKRWQLVQSSGSPKGTTVDDAGLQQFLTWAKARYPKATFREVRPASSVSVKRTHAGHYEGKGTGASGRKYPVEIEFMETGYGDKGWVYWLNGNRCDFPYATKRAATESLERSLQSAYQEQSMAITTHTTKATYPCCDKPARLTGPAAVPKQTFTRRCRPCETTFMVSRSTMHMTEGPLAGAIVDIVTWLDTKSRLYLDKYG